MKREYRNVYNYSDELRRSLDYRNNNIEIEEFFQNIRGVLVTEVLNNIYREFNDVNDVVVVYKFKLYTADIIRDDLNDVQELDRHTVLHEYLHNALYNDTYTYELRTTVIYQNENDLK